jgi:hypothetical protein
MQKFIKKTIGKEVHNFVVEGKTLHDVVIEAGKLSFPNVYKCGICGGDHLALSAHVAQDFPYTTIKCLNPECKASLNFGQQKKDPTVYYLRTKEDRSFDWKPFVPKED